MYFVCCDPWRTPAPAQIDLACDIVRGAAKQYDVVEACNDGKVRFYYNCDGGWDTFCPRCGRQMPMPDLTDWLSEDFDRDVGFRLIPRAMPCCDAPQTLEKLTFRPPAAFAKFAVDVQNPHWTFADDAPSAPAIAAMAEAYRRTKVLDERWREVSRDWGNEVNAGIERLAERVDEALGAPVRVVLSHV